MPSALRLFFTRSALTQCESGTAWHQYFFAVNFFAFNVLHMKHIYKQYAAVDTVDFSDVQLDEAALKRFETHDLINPRPAIFARAISMEERHAELRARGLSPAAIQEYEESQAAQGGPGGVGAATDSRNQRSGSRSVLNPLSAGGGMSSPRSTSSRSDRIASMQGLEMASSVSTDNESEPEVKAPPATERTLSGNERVAAAHLPKPRRRSSGLGPGRGRGR